jgi:hypothetical protein
MKLEVCERDENGGEVCTVTGQLETCSEVPVNQPCAIRYVQDGQSADGTLQIIFASEEPQVGDALRPVSPLQQSLARLLGVNEQLLASFAVNEVRVLAALINAADRDLSIKSLGFLFGGLFNQTSAVEMEALLVRVKEKLICFGMMQKVEAIFESRTS